MGEDTSNWFAVITREATGPIHTDQVKTNYSLLNDPYILEGDV